MFRSENAQGIGRPDLAAKSLQLRKQNLGKAASEGLLTSSFPSDCPANKDMVVNPLQQPKNI
jgi:hypothetical protein